MYEWSRIAENNYEVSTKGDKRFSALLAELKDGRTIEEAYQLDIKGYRIVSNDWKIGKGKPPLSFDYINKHILSTIDEISIKYKYKPLSKDNKEIYHKLYKDNLNGFNCKRNLNINNVKIANNYERVVIGDYGAYVEIAKGDLIIDLIIPENQKWRFDTKFLKDRNLNIKYLWYEYNGYKVYLQTDTVAYADYKPGFYYISVLYFDVLKEKSKEEIYLEYKNLWSLYFNENPNLLEEISILAKDKVLTDMFAYTEISQARAIAEILNEKIGEDKMVVNDKELEKSLLELNKLSLHRLNKAERTSSLKWGFRKGYPRLMVFINGSDLSVRGRDNMIIAPFGFTALNTLTGAMAEIIEAEKGTEFTINCINAKYVDNKKTDETTIQATVVVGKDQDGMIFISLSEENKPTVRFNLTLNEEWNPVTMNGVNIGLTEFGSKMFTKRYLNQIETVYNNILAATTTYKTEENIV